LAPLLKRTGPLNRDPFFWHYPHYSNQGGKPGGAIRDVDFKLIESYEGGYLELYNLADDPGETNNIAGAQPQRANELAKKLADWRRRIHAEMMTTNAAYEPVPIPPSADGTVVLPAHEATLHGSTLRYEPPAHKNTLGYWTKKEDWVSWEFTVAKPGKFSVEVLQGCGKGSGGADVEVSVGAEPAPLAGRRVPEPGGPVRDRRDSPARIDPCTRAPVSRHDRMSCLRSL